MKRCANQFLMVCLMSLPAAAFADVYPLNSPPDLFIDTISYTGPTLSGTVESITDVGNCSAIPCFAGLEFSWDLSGFEVTDGVNVYLAGNEVPGSAVALAGGEAGVLFTVTIDDLALWSALEGQAASSFGSEVAMDLHGFDASDTSGDVQSNAVADMTPTATPEPASMTLLFTGLVAGFARKRMAKKRNNQILA